VKTNKTEISKSVVYCKFYFSCRYNDYN